MGSTKIDRRPGPLEYECSFCGELATAYWSTDYSAVFVCRTCAIEALPQLMADAVAHNNEDAENGRAQAVQGIMGAFSSKNVSE